MQNSVEILIKEINGFRDTAEKDGENLYKAICDIIVNSNELLEIADYVLMGQPTANIFLGGIHYLLLKGNESPLSKYYATVQGENARDVDENLEKYLIEFVEEHRSELIEICKTKRVQTNEVGRCSFVLPGMNYLHTITKKPIILLEVGTSAGLLLHFDKYRIEYSDGRVGGDTKSSLEMKCTIQGDISPPLTSYPQIIRRIGIDVEPIDVMDEESAFWLMALVWPSNVARYKILQSAIEISRKNQKLVELLKGDGFREITKFLKQFLSNGESICIYHSFAINQIPKEDRKKFLESLKQFSSNESTTIYELTVKWNANEKPTLVFNTYDHGMVSTVILAKIHHHGRWVEWLIE